MVAAVLILIAAAAVVGTVVTGSWLAVSVAAGAAVLMGAGATKITHTELLDSRRDAARDRAEQAQAFRRLADARAEENLEFVADVQTRMAQRDAAVERLERRLADAAAELADARRELTESRERAETAERERDRLAEQYGAAEERATQAVVRVAELEAELQTLRAELDGWKAHKRTRSA